MIACALATTGCKGLYSTKADPLKSPGDVKRHVDPPDPSLTIKYVDDCPTNFRADPRGVVRDPKGAKRFVDSGEASIALAAKQPDPTAQASTVKTGIDSYRTALSYDPYNADATLDLALAYDKVYRKGCALKLLARISALPELSLRGQACRRSRRRYDRMVQGVPERGEERRRSALTFESPRPSRYRRGHG